MALSPAGNKPVAELAVVRRFEAAGFRAWPATSVYYDGTWIVRLTPDYPAKRLNSVNPLDPADTGDVALRVARAAARFELSGRPLTFRLSPLSGPAIAAHLDEKGWSRFSESLVMRLSLDDDVIHGAMDQIPMKDMGRFVAAAVATHDMDPGLRAGLAGIIGAIEPEAGLFVLERDEQPLTTAVCVHDGDLAGLFEIATLPSERGKGFGKRVILSALKWARLRGAKQAWLQVEADNFIARRLYQTLGFEEVYRYHYRQLRSA